MGPTGWVGACTESHVTGPAEGRGGGQDVGKAAGPQGFWEWSQWQRRRAQKLDQTR